MSDIPQAVEPASGPPSLAEWAGGGEAFARIFTRFYERVREDAVLAPVFAAMDPHHAEHVARFVTEVLGGARLYSQAGGSHAGMISRHMDRHLTHYQRRRWMALLLDTADSLDLADDPEFRASLVGYLEWGSRLAVMNSQAGVPPPDADMPMPAWTWSSPGGPYQP
ncbi:group II truncated hemoglobin [Sphingomonas sp. BT-65]|uniref:group II truncated hemoglobin n=1 Tax=Sphingomonas sp. BT-65 TaxID=2989821 RepID=UPI002235A436|nr:group II truncated hemoglobin [Sphingomonas sp. BT-65]MCW4462328.1 group II truncated hemoglobin [Sphingomonas sp. BT-65]